MMIDSNDDKEDPLEERVYFQTPSSEQCLQWLAVLSSQNIDYFLEKNEYSIWKVIIVDEQGDKAKLHIGEFNKENDIFFEESFEAKDKFSFASFFFSFVLFLIFFITGPASENHVWFNAGSAQSAKILGGEFFRCFTAQALHVDLPHVFMNAMCCYFLGSFLCNVAGEGVSWLLLIVGAAIGNYWNAMYHTSHLNAV